MSVVLAQAEQIESNQNDGTQEILGAELTPRAVVAELDRYVIGQADAKRAVAIALRNRWRRLQVEQPLQDEITPKNILMIGPTGVGKTEISRRLAKLAKAPFVKVEASKFTEIGYVGRDVDSIVRDLVEVSLHMVRDEERLRVAEQAEHVAQEELLDLLLPGSRKETAAESLGNEGRYGEGAETQGEVFLQSEDGIGFRAASQSNDSAVAAKTREKLRTMLAEGKLDDRIVEVELERPVSTHLQVMGPQGFAEIEGQIKDMLSSMVPSSKMTKKMPVKEARRILLDIAKDKLLDKESVVEKALKRAEQVGIVFIDEIDKVCGRSSQGSSQGPDVSREGVQRDLLPLVEGCTVNTKHGAVDTTHILFIASGAFHISKPSDLMPEFQGRFPIRVELKALSAEDFVRILTEPDNALVKQYQALLATEGVRLEFSADGIQEIARLTADVNSRTENIGARRLHTLLEKLLEDISFEAADGIKRDFCVDQAFVRERLAGIAADVDLSRFIL